MKSKNNVIHALYFILYFLILFATHYDVMLVISYIEWLEYSNDISFTIFLIGWISFFILLTSNILVFKYLFRLALRLGVLIYIPVLANFIIAFNYVYNIATNFSVFFYIVIFIGLSIVNFLLYTSITVITNADKTNIKKLILNLGTRFTILEIGDISEKSGINVRKAEAVIVEMIENDEIYAAYNENTKIVQFSQDANLKEIDKLMSIYKSWEKESNKKTDNTLTL